MNKPYFVPEEQLRESIESLTQRNRRERQRRIDTELILEGNHKLSIASTANDAFRVFLKLIEQFFHYENALILHRFEHHAWKMFFCDDSRQTLNWIAGDLTERVLQNDVSVVFDVSQVFEFQNMPEHWCKARYGSAILSGLRSEMGQWLLLLGHHQVGQFGQDNRHLLKRLLPLLRQRLVNLEYQEHLKSIVAQRTEALRYSEQRFMSFAQTASDWFWETDANYRLIYISSGLGLESRPIYGHLLGRSLLSLQVHEHVEAAVFPNLLHERQSLRNILFVIDETENQPSFWGELSGEPYLDSHGRFAGFRGSVRDVTQERADRRALRLAKEEAERANHAKSDFLAMMSHEIRTPMNAIVGMIELLKDELHSTVAKSLLQNAQQASQLLLNIINDVLDISKLEAGRLQLEQHRFLLSDVIDQVVDQLTETAKAKGLVIRRDIQCCRDVYLIGDSYRLAQILLNLVANGIKFTDHGGLTITLSGHCESKDLCQFELAVQDTGIGIPQEDIELLFEPFRQLSQSHARLYGGTGLGLAIVKQLVDAMGGQLWVNSQVGEGSCFTVCLTLPKSRCILSDKPRLDYLPTIPTKKILVVEDSPSNQLVIRLMLEKLGHQVIIAQDGASALDVQDLTTVDLILMDLQMPGIDGYETTRCLRNKGILCPIIALTANTQERERCIGAGMNDLVSKPLRRQVLQSFLYRLFNSSADNY